MRLPLHRAAMALAMALVARRGAAKEPATPPPRVTIVCDDASLAYAHRLRAELGAVHIDRVRVEKGVAPTADRKPGSAVVVELVQSHGAVAVRVFPRARHQRPIVDRLLGVENRPLDDSLVAARALELVRVAFAGEGVRLPGTDAIADPSNEGREGDSPSNVDSAIAAAVASSSPSAPPVAASAEQTAMPAHADAPPATLLVAPPPPSPSPDAHDEGGKGRKTESKFRFPPVFAEGGIAGGYSPGGLGPSVHAVAALRASVTTDVDAGVVLVAPLAASTGNAPGGRLQLEPWLAGATVRGGLFTPTPRLCVTWEAGGAFAVLAIRGDAESPYRGHQRTMFNAAILVRGGMAYEITPTLRARADVTVSAFLVRSVILQNESEVANWGLPLFLASASLEVKL